MSRYKGRERRSWADPLGHRHDIFSAPYRIDADGSRLPVVYPDGCEYLGEHVTAKRAATYWRESDVVWEYTT